MAGEKWAMNIDAMHCGPGSGQVSVCPVQDRAPRLIDPFFLR